MDPWESTINNWGDTSQEHVDASSGGQVSRPGPRPAEQRSDEWEGLANSPGLAKVLFHHT